MIQKNLICNFYSTMTSIALNPSQNSTALNPFKKNLQGKSCLQRKTTRSYALKKPGSKPSMHKQRTAIRDSTCNTVWKLRMSEYLRFELKLVVYLLGPLINSCKSNDLLSLVTKRNIMSEITTEEQHICSGNQDNSCQFMDSWSMKKQSWGDILYFILPWRAEIRDYLRAGMRMHRKFEGNWEWRRPQKNWQPGEWLGVEEDFHVLA